MTDQPTDPTAEAQKPVEPEMFGPEVVAYRHPTKLRAYLCRQHGDGKPGLTPVEADDLEYGGGCDVCGVDVLIPQQQAGEGAVSPDCEAQQQAGPAGSGRIYPDEMETGLAEGRRDMLTALADAVVTTISGVDSAAVLDTAADAMAAKHAATRPAGWVGRGWIADLLRERACEMRAEDARHH